MNGVEKIEVIADLSVSVGESVAAVSAFEDKIRVDFASLGDAIAFWRHSDRHLREIVFGALRRVVQAGPTELSVQIERDTVATLRPNSRASLFGRLFGLPPLKLRWGSLLRRFFGLRR